MFSRSSKYQEDEEYLWIRVEKSLNTEGPIFKTRILSKLLNCMIRYIGKLYKNGFGSSPK